MSQKDNLLVMVDHLTEFVAGSEGQSADEVIEELRSEGVDVDRGFQEFMKTVAECSARSRRRDLELANSAGGRSPRAKRGEHSARAACLRERA